MQKSIRGRTTMMTQLHMPEIPGNNLKPDPKDVNLIEAPKGMNYCPLSNPKEDKRREVDALIQEYTQLRTRLADVEQRLHHLGVNAH